MARNPYRTNTGQATCGNTAGGTEILPANPDRVQVEVWNTDAAATGFVGVGAISGTVKSIPVPAGKSVVLYGRDQIKGFIGSGTVVFAYAELVKS